MTSITCRMAIFLLLFAFSASFKISAQKNDSITLSTLSIDEATEHALQNSHKLYVITLEEKLEREKLNQIRIEYFPNLYITSDLRRNLIIPTTPIPASMLNPGAGNDELMYMRFNTAWNATAGLNLSFDVFNPLTFGKSSEQKQQLAVSALERAIEQKNIRTLTYNTYIDCLIAGIQYRRMAADSTLYYNLYEEAARLYEKGYISLVEKNNAEINLHTSVSKIAQSDIIYREAKSNLLAVMGFDAKDENIQWLNLSQSIEELFDRFHTYNGVEGGSLLQNKQKEMVKLAQIKTQNAKLQYLPKLTLNGYYGANYFDRHFNIINNDKWFGNSFVSLTLRIPVSEAINNSKNVAQFKIKELIEIENLREVNQSVADELKREQSTVNLKIIDYDMKKKNLELHQSNVKAKSIQYEKGYLQRSELLSEILSEQNAFQEYLKSAHDLLSTFISIDQLMK